MKKSILLAAPALVLASCASDAIVDEHLGGYTGKTDAPIGFITNQKNITRAKNLQDTKHYNFGVFAYKDGETVNNVMENYLVGYNGNNVGYYMTTGNQTTLGDQPGLEDGKSQWQYEKLGYAEYDYSGEGFYKTSDVEYMSNVANQYLRYWDLAANSTYFYAYSPYIHGAEGVTASYVDGTAKGTSADTYVLTIPNGSLKDGYDDPALSEYMYASTKVKKTDYGKDVRLEFKRLNAKVNIKFWEDIEGYSVRILDLSSTHQGVQAAASIQENGAGHYGYRKGVYYKENGVKIQFADGQKTAIKQYEGKLSSAVATADQPLVFAAPTAPAIGTTRLSASESETDYYAIPKGDGADVLKNTGVNITDVQPAEADLAKTGFTFHVSYELTSTTGERIIVKDATVHVPFGYANWKENTHYTYIFKITKNSNGSTDPEVDDDIDPTDPEVPTEAGLYPIVFDNCTVEDWIENESEYEITPGTGSTYYNVVLSDYSMTNSQDNNITVTVERTSAHLGNGTINDAVVTVNGPASYDASKIEVSAGSILVKAGATVGTYTVTYTCDATDIDHDHTRTYTETFVVGNDYTVATTLPEVGTGGEAAAKLAITTTKNTTAEATPEGNFVIEYPKNITDDGKVAVSGTDITVAKDAKVGSYTLAYKVDGVVVARVEFAVVKYNFVLSQDVIGLDASPVVVTITPWGNYPGKISMNTIPGITVDATANTISVANTTAVGTYDVIYTVHAGENSEIKYKKSITVKNTYAVTLDVNEIDHDADPAETIVITTKKNGVEVTGQKANLAVQTEAGVAAPGFTISDDHKLTVAATVAPGNYKVVYTGETGVTVEAAFVVND